MKTLTITLILLFSVSNASAIDKWSWSDTGKQLAFAGLHYIDYRQTQAIFKSPLYYERNSLITERNMDTFFALTFIGHTLISVILPAKPVKWLFGLNREWWQKGFIIGKGVVVFNNYFIGIRW